MVYREIVNLIGIIDLALVFMVGILVSVVC